MNGTLKILEQKYTIKHIEKKFERGIKKSMQLCQMKPLTQGQEADIKAYFKNAVFGLVLSANRLGDWLRDRLDPTRSAA